VTRDGAELSGAVSGLGLVQAELGGYAVNVDLAKAAQIVLEGAEEVVDRVGYAVTVRVGDRIVNRLAGALAIEGGLVVPPSPGAAPVIEAPKLAAAKTVVPLPAEIEQLAVGGGGRY